MITIKKDYKRHTCTRDIPSIQDPDLELYYVYNDHISIHNNSLQQYQTLMDLHTEDELMLELISEVVSIERLGPIHVSTPRFSESQIKSL
jgi:hypothetical protein